MYRMSSLYWVTKPATSLVCSYKLNLGDVVCALSNETDATKKLINKNIRV